MTFAASLVLLTSLVVLQLKWVRGGRKEGRWNTGTREEFFFLRLILKIRMSNGDHQCHLFIFPLIYGVFRQTRTILFLCRCVWISLLPASPSIKSLPFLSYSRPDSPVVILSLDDPCFTEQRRSDRLSKEHFPEQQTNQGGRLFNRLSFPIVQC